MRARTGAAMAMCLGLALVAASAAPASAAAADAGGLAAWAVDPHTKVFRDAAPPAEAGAVPGTVRMRAARNEYEPGQIAVRSQSPCKGVRIEVSPLRHADGKAVIGGVRWNFVGFIRVVKNSPGAERLQVRAAPCDIPDPLLEARAMDLEAGATQPVWLTVRVPRDAAPGLYRGEVAVVAEGIRAAVPVELAVDAFALPDARHLLVTNWFHPDRVAKYHKVDMYSEAFWALLERYAENLAAHRQNVIRVPWQMIGVTREADGRLSFDYTTLDRFVTIFEKAGAADRIELSHLGNFAGGDRTGSEIALSSVAATDRATGGKVQIPPEEGLPPLLADLERHLAGRGWLAKAMIHIADEPEIRHAASWRRASEFVHKAAPRLRRIDAISSLDYTGALEVWVPKLSTFDNWRAAYEARRQGNEFWYYICMHPVGNFYPNRFLDYPLACVRVLHWINFSEDLAGYLHWGLDSWRDDPYGPPPTEKLPPGDTHAIYPGSAGPADSLRWEIQRESIEDYEYLHLLAEKAAALKARLGPAAAWADPRRRAVELARRVVPALSACEFDPGRIAAARRAAADEILALDAAPAILVETEPPAGSTLVHGPAGVEVRGAVPPASTVKVNNQAVAVGADGFFGCRTAPSRDACEVRIEVDAQGARKVLVRGFTLRK